MLIRFLEEDELRMSAIFSLGKRTSKKALTKIEYYLENGNRDEKKEAKEAMKKAKT